jgi:RHS repeat-associated protein
MGNKAVNWGALLTLWAFAFTALASSYAALSQAEKPFIFPDAASRVIATTDALGRTTEYEYDRAGRRTLVRDNLGQETSFEYDANGNLLTVTDAAGRTTTYTYDDLNRRTATTFADGTSVTTTYDELGRVTDETDQANRTKTYAYDALGRLGSVVDALGQTTAFSYDELGNTLTQVDALGRISRYDYDVLGRRVKRTLPLGMFETMSYDAAGNVASRVDFKGRTTTFGYDSMNRLTAKVPDAALGEPTVSYTYHANGRRVTMTDGTGTTSYAYDVRDRLTQKATPQGTLGYSYNAAGELIGTASEAADGVSVTYTHDTLGRLASVTDRELGATNYAYDVVGNLAAFTTPNGITHSYTYDALNRLTNLKVGIAPAYGIANYTYTLSPTGRRNKVVENFSSQGATSTREVTWQYDLLDRLTREIIAVPQPSTFTPQPSGQTNYTYDAVGNRLSRTSTVPGLTTQAFGYDANDRLTSDTYDANGNTTTGKVPQPTVSQVPLPVPPETTVTDSYDFEDRLKSRTGGGVNVTVLYNGDGQRVAETVNGITTTYLVDDLNPTGYAQVVEERTAGVVTRTYTYGHDLLAQDTRNGANQWSAQYFGYDGSGSVRFLTDELGTVTDTYSYDAFGTLLASTGTTANRFRYGGEEYDPALGLYHLRARYMNAASGRFWNADTYEGTASDPLSLHKYNYAYNNPANLSDPSGHSPLATLMCNMALSLYDTSSDLKSARNADGTWNAEQLGSISSNFMASQVNGLFGFNPVQDLMDAYATVDGLWSLWKMLQALGGEDEDVLFSEIGKAWIRMGYSRQMAEEMTYGTYFDMAVSSVLNEGGDDWTDDQDDIAPQCFAKETSVAVKGGRVPIESLRKGDKVLAFNEKTNALEEKVVVRAFTIERADSFVVETENERIHTTYEHPFFEKTKGWTAAGALSPGDRLMVFEGGQAEAVVVGTSRATGEIIVHNLEVEGLHTFLVGEDGVAVHNVSAGRHHFFTRALGSRVPYGSKILKNNFLNSIQHTRVHKKMNEHLLKKTKVVGGVTVDMMPRKGNAGTKVRRNFSLQEREDALDGFYSGYQGGKYKMKYLIEKVRSKRAGLLR